MTAVDHIDSGTRVTRWWPALAGLAAGATIAYGIAGGADVAAVWDVHHHRTGRVVVRSLAEFCVVLDTVLAVLVLVVTFA